jgi:hypothetical protein
MSKQGFETTLECLRSRRKPPAPVLLERLAETGFLATELGMDEKAERIFHCVATLRPQRPAPLIALAMVHARRGWLEQAIAELRELIAQQPDCDLAKAVLGTMLIHVEQPGALQLFEEVLEHNRDAGAVGIAGSCIDAARRASAARGSVSAESCEFFRYYNVRA